MIYFAILAHENEDVLSEQIKNVRYFNPNSKVVLYNGGTNKQFGVNQNIPICPYSRPLRWGYTSPYFFNVMRWLEEINAEYDFIVNLDHDVLFIKPGFEQFLEDVMQFHDCMGSYLQTHYSPNHNSSWFPGVTMWREWDKWKNFFQTSYFYSYFNPGQIYRHSIVKEMLSEINIKKLEKLWSTTKVIALDEMLFITLAISKGAKYRGYPWSLEDGKNYVIDKGSISLDKIKEALTKPNFYWVHPIKGKLLIETNESLIEMYSKK